MGKREQEVQTFTYKDVMGVTMYNMEITNTVKYMTSISFKMVVMAA